jgi:hypothetical protein
MSLESCSNDKAEKDELTTIASGPRDEEENRAAAPVRDDPKAAPPYRELDEAMFQLASYVFSQPGTTGEPQSTVLDHFIAVLGIQADGAGFLTPFHHTSKISGLIWIGRVVLLELALPRYAYRLLSDLAPRSKITHLLERL